MRVRPSGVAAFEWLIATCAWFLTASCNSTATPPNPVSPGSAPVQATQPASPGAVLGGAPAAPSGSSGRASTAPRISSSADAGVPTAAASGSAPVAAAGVSSPSAGNAAAASGTGGGDSAGAAASAGAAGAGSVQTGPLDYAKAGPYEVIRDQPVGEGFEYPIASSDTGDGVAGCQDFAGGFGGDADEAKTFVMIPADLKMDMYSLYRPARLEEGKKYPLITWGNGTCALPEGYGAVLKHLASHGFFVVAANSRQVGMNAVMTKALDWAFAANEDSKSPYYHRIDTDKVGAAGHSQGGAATISAASDSRIKTVIIFNGGSSAAKPFLAISGDRDIPFVSLASLKSGVQAAPKAAWLWYHMVPERGQYDGHLTLIVQPERVVGPSAAWFKYILDNDALAKDWLVGASCKLCGMDAMFEYGQHGL